MRHVQIGLRQEFHNFFFPYGCPPRGSGQIAYKRPTLLAPDLTVINTEFFSQTTASICLTLVPHSLKRYFNCNTSISNFSPYPGKVNFLVLDIDLGRAFLRTLGHQNQFSAQPCAVLRQADVELWTDTTIKLQTFDVPVRAWSEDTQ